MRTILLVLLLPLFAASQPALAQLGYPYPYSYPRIRTRPQNTTGIPGDDAKVAGTFRGPVKQLSKKEIVIEKGEDQDVVLRITKKTKFMKDGKEIKASAIETNMLVSVDAAEDVDLKPTALTVTVVPPQKGARTAAAQTNDPPNAPKSDVK